MAEAAVAHRQPKAFAARILATLAGILTIIVGFGVLFEVSMAGFPDGAVTEYDRVVQTPLTILGVLSICTGPYFFYLAIFTKGKHLLATLVISIILYCVLVPGTLFGMDYYIKNFTNIDYGQGG
jgi:hypothetical protein